MTKYLPTTRLPLTESEVSRLVGEAIGAGSMCWENVRAAGVFESRDAARVANETVATIVQLVGLGEPHLGCATTRELLDEIAARVNLQYRTVGDPS